MTEIEVRECVWCGKSFTTTLDLREKCGECYLRTQPHAQNEDIEPPEVFQDD